MSITILEPRSILMVRALAGQMDIEARARSVAGTILDNVFPDRAKDTTFVTSLSRCSLENVTGAVKVLAGRLALQDVDPRCAREFAGLVARLNIPLAELERSYWVGIERLWQEWFDLCRTSSGDGNGELTDLLGGSTSLLFGYVDRVLAQVVRHYTAVTEDMATTCQDRRRDLVLRILAGDAVEPVESMDTLLGYRMRATHVGLFISGDGWRGANRLLTSLREHSGAPIALLVASDAGTWFGWLGYHDGVDPHRLAVLRQVATDSGKQVVIGEPSHGLGGFRRSHESARRTSALRTRLRDAPGCLCARELRLETFLLENPASARRFVNDELGGLAIDTERAQRIRDTLLTWLATGSQARAATQLGVHENTVRLRVRCAGEELGAALATRRTELLVALRLRAALGPESSPSTAH